VDENGKKLYVGNLPWAATEADLLELFSDYGEVVDAYVIQDRATGRSRGFGFVEFNNVDSVQEVVVLLDGAKFQGRTLILKPARPKPPRDS